MTTMLHPDRYAPCAIGPRNGVVVHDSEGAEGLLPWGQMSSDQLIGLLKAKGDRPSPSRPGGFYGAGYQAVATESGSYVTMADDDCGPYHAGGSINPNFWSICIPGRAAQTREQWLNDVSRMYIRGAAHYIADRWHHDAHLWPLQFVSGAELARLKANVRGNYAGYTSHAQITVSKLTSTDHTDPGVGFPWDVLAADIAELIAPHLETDMALIVKPYDGDPADIPAGKINNGLLDTAAFALTGGIATWTQDPWALSIQQALGTVPAQIKVVHRSWLKAYTLVGDPPPPGYGYIVPGRGAGTLAGDFAN